MAAPNPTPEEAAFGRLAAEAIAIRDRALLAACEAYDAAIQALANRYNCEILTGHMNDSWQVMPRNAKEPTLIRDAPHLPISRNLAALDQVGAELGIGPTNCMRITPKS